ncbi:MAG: tetratricopeptide repeat protein, partial [Terriglobales bacterium]
MQRSARCAVVWGLLLLLVAGCTRDPNVKKREYVESGDRYFAGRQYREAVIQYSNALQVDPRDAPAHYKLAQSHLRLGSAVAAFNELMRTVDLDPQNWKAQVDLGNLLLGAHQYDQALERGQLVLKGDASNVEAQILVANTYFGMGYEDRAMAAMKKALEMAPNRAETYVNLAIQQSLAGKATAAEESFQKGLAIEPRSARVHQELGHFYGQQKRWAEAEEELRAARDLEPQNPV